MKTMINYIYRNVRIRSEAEEPASQIPKQATTGQGLILIWFIPLVISRQKLKQFFPLANWSIF